VSEAIITEGKKRGVIDKNYFRREDSLAIRKNEGIQGFSSVGSEKNQKGLKTKKRKGA